MAPDTPRDTVPELQRSYSAPSSSEEVRPRSESLPSGVGSSPGRNSPTARWRIAARRAAAKVADLTEPVLGEASQRLRRASIDSSNPKVRRATEQAVEVWRKLGDQTNVVKHRAAVVKHKAAEQLEKTREAAKAPRRMMTNFEFYLLWALIFLVVGYFAVFSILKLLTKVRVIWFLTRAEYLDDFRRWTSEVCAEPWQHETVLCQAADGNWIARELIRAKIAAKDEDNCDPGTNDGCRYEACSERGLSSVLHKLASSPFSPLNAPGPVHFALLPILKPLKVLLDDLSQGKLKLSEVCTARAQFSARNSRRAILAARFCALRRDALTTDIRALGADQRARQQLPRHQDGGQAQDEGVAVEQVRLPDRPRLGRRHRRRAAQGAEGLRQGAVDDHEGDP